MQEEPQAVDPLNAIAIGLASRLMQKLQGFESKVSTKYEYYNADNEIRDFGVSSPLSMNRTVPGIGWASRCVNTLSDRVEFDGFANDTFGVNDYWTNIGAYSVITKAKHDAFIAGVAFVAVSDDNVRDRKTLIPFTAAEATGELDQATGLLKWGLAVLRWDEATGSQKIKGKSSIQPADYVLFTPTFTAIFKGRTLSEIIPNPTGRVLLHPLTHRSSADKPLGKSRLTNSARRIINEVGRLKRREEIAQEFYALPQRYINGLAEGAKKDKALDSAIGKIWTITKDEDGDKPEIGQLPQMQISQFTESKKDKARDFCAETALTLRNLGYETGNPSSAENLAAMSDDLLLEAQKSQQEMGEQIKQIAITLRMAIDGVVDVPDALKTLIPAWKPIFQVDLGAAGDAIFKLFQTMPELQGTVAGYRMLGIPVREAEALAARRSAALGSGFMNNGETA